MKPHFCWSKNIWCASEIASLFLFLPNSVWFIPRWKKCSIVKTRENGRIWKLEMESYVRLRTMALTYYFILCAVEIVRHCKKNYNDVLIFLILFSYSPNLPAKTTLRCIITSKLSARSYGKSELILSGEKHRMNKDKYEAIYDARIAHVARQSDSVGRKVT